MVMPAPMGGTTVVPGYNNIVTNAHTPSTQHPETTHTRSIMADFPAGITGWDHMPYPSRRWNGTVWPEPWVDDYNKQLDRIRWAHEGNLASTQDEVEAFYRTNTTYDLLEKESLDKAQAAGTPLPDRYHQV